MFQENDATIAYRPAGKADARALAKLTEIAGEGIAGHLWSQQAGPGEEPLDVGTARAQREDANFSYRNASVALCDGTVIGMVLAYPLPQPGPEDIAALDELPALLRPLVELEHLVPGSYYINALAVFDGHRDRGIGQALIGIAEQRARNAGCDSLSIMVFAENEGACRLYRRAGFAIADRRPIVAHACYPYSTEVLLMTRPVAA